MKRLLYTLILLYVSVATVAHPIKMSTGRMEVDSKTESISLLLNFFIDDFEPSIRQLYPQPEFNFEQQSDEMTYSIHDYVQKNLIIKADKDVVGFNLISIKKSEDNVCLVTFNGKHAALKTCDKFTIHNTLLFDIYDKQSNILHIKIDGNRAGILEFYPSSAVKFIKK